MLQRVWVARYCSLAHRPDSPYSLGSVTLVSSQPSNVELPDRIDSRSASTSLAETHGNRGSRGMGPAAAAFSFSSRDSGREGRRSSPFLPQRTYRREGRTAPPP